MSDFDFYAPLEASVTNLLRRGSTGYDEARRKLSWNQRLACSRTPDAIVSATSVAEVAATVRFAAEHRWRVSVRGSGHSYEASALQSGGIMLDLGGLNHIEVDPETRTARVGAGVKGGDLLESLANFGLAFPVGHCADVALSGYILSGGFGWNSGTWGPAIASVLEIEMVLASGEIVVASANHQPDLFWAARGAGTGIFAAITSYRLRLHDVPETAVAMMASFKMGSAQTIAPWLDAATEKAGTSAEITCLVGPHFETGEPSISIHASAVGATHDEAEDQIKAFFDLPDDAETIGSPRRELLDFGELTKLSAMPDGKRAACDHCWVQGSLGAMLLAVEHLADVPDKASSINLFALGGNGKVASPPDDSKSALSIGGGIGVGTYALWDDKADDLRHMEWVRSVDLALTPFRIGRYVGEADLSADTLRLDQCFTRNALLRIERLRRVHDPDWRFSGFPGLRIKIWAEDILVGVGYVRSVDDSMGCANAAFEPTTAYRPILHAVSVGDRQQEPAVRLTATDSHGHPLRFGVWISDYLDDLGEAEAHLLPIDRTEFDRCFSQLPTMEIDHW